MKKVIQWIRGFFTTPKHKEEYPTRVKDPVMHVTPILDHAPKPQPITFQTDLYSVEYQDGSVAKIKEVDEEVKISVTNLNYLTSFINDDIAAILKVEVPDPEEFPEVTTFVFNTDSRHINNIQCWNATIYRVKQRFVWGEMEGAKAMAKAGLIGPDTHKVGMSPLNYPYQKWLIEKGKVDILKSFRKKWEIRHDGLTPAAKNGDVAMVDFLLRYAQDNYLQHTRAFFEAVNRKYFECADMILVFAKNYSLSGSIENAIEKDEPEIVTYLLKKQIHYELNGQIYQTLKFMSTVDDERWLRGALQLIPPKIILPEALLSISRASDLSRLTEFSDESRALEFESKRLVKNKDNTPLLNAAESGLYYLTRDMIPESDQQFKDMALCRAIKKGYLGIVKLLLEHGADPECYQGLPMKHAVNFGRKRITRFLENRE